MQDAARVSVSASIFLSLSSKLRLFSTTFVNGKRIVVESNLDISQGLFVDIAYLLYNNRFALDYDL